jgi:hypothetical protein
MSGESRSPLVTVSVPTYNSSATLRLALEALRRQDFTDFEAWVVGDGCTDDSATVVASFNDPRLHWVNLESNSGSQSAPNNEALRRAKGPYVACLGHDDLWFPWHLSGLVSHIEKTGADLVHSLCALIGRDGLREAIGPPRKGADYNVHFTPPSTWLHRRETLAELGGWRDPRGLRWPVDFDVTQRLHQAGRRIEFVPALSVLKFPSSWWRMYSRTGEPPQAPFFRNMQTNPDELHRQTLFELSVALSRNNDCGQPTKKTIPLAAREAWRAARSSVWGLTDALFDLYGRDRWPLDRFLIRRYQRLRAKHRPGRGLPPREAL